MMPTMPLDRNLIVFALSSIETMLRDAREGFTQAQNAQDAAVELTTEFGEMGPCMRDLQPSIDALDANARQAAMNAVSAMLKVKAEIEKDEQARFERPGGRRNPRRKE